MSNRSKMSNHSKDVLSSKDGRNTNLDITNPDQTQLLVIEENVFGPPLESSSLVFADAALEKILDAMNTEMTWIELKD